MKIRGSTAFSRFIRIARRLAIIPLALISSASFAAPIAPAAAVRAWRSAHEREYIEEFMRFVAIPNVTADRAGIRRNAEFIAGLLRARGVEGVRFLEPASGVGNPVVFGEVNVPGAKRTLVLYAHYDGQPVNPAQWAPNWEPYSPRFVTAPFERGGQLVAQWRPGDPVNPEWRITGRGAADDKAGVFTLLNTYAALRAAGIAPSANLRFFFDGEEERGSPHLREILTTHRDLLRGDLWLILDGPLHPSGRKTVVFGVRGTVNVALTTFAAKRPLHSGNYGNWAPNPAWLLVNLLASMKDEHGRVLIDGFYDDVTPLAPAERAALAAIPAADAELAHELGLAQPEAPGRTLLQALHLPSLNINGIGSGNVGPLASNVIPTTAQVTLNLRLVPGNDVRRQVAKLVAHIRGRGFHVLERPPSEEERLRHPRLIRVETTGGYNAQRTPMDLPLAQAVLAAVRTTTSEPVIAQPSLGGSLPLSVIEEVLGTHVMIVPVVNADNNQHAENENVKVQALWDGLETYAALLTMP